MMEERQSVQPEFLVNGFMYRWEWERERAFMDTVHCRVRVTVRY